MIPRHQIILFAVLFVASALMTISLWHLRERAHERMLAGQDSAPTKAPQVTPAEQATLVIASDADGSLSMQTQTLPLPQEPGSRARAILDKLLAMYAENGAAHPIPGDNSAVQQVFLLPMPGASSAAANTAAGKTADVPQIAVVNLSQAFANNHPAGLETETLTILSICGTIHANLPNVTQVRFLVDGQQQDTLAGHADLTRTYLTSDTGSGVQQ